MSENQITILRPFGPSIAKVKLPNELIDSLNDYIDKTILDEEKIKQLDHGDKLEGNVKQEFKLEDEFLKSSNLLEFLGKSTANWLKHSDNTTITSFNVLSSWIVRQFKNEYNPLHFHGGHISGVGYLKLPKDFGKTYQTSKKNNTNGKIALVHGSKMFNSKSILTIKPEVGDFYIFPHYLMHTVYPFASNEEERRSISFNALIDEKIFNVYGQ
jgi:hypothetical protein